MSTCTPKEFYMLVPTLFDQSLKAYQTGMLALDTVKSGLECRSKHFPLVPFQQLTLVTLVLLEPSLLPSLIAGFGWAARKLWEAKHVAPYLEYLLPLIACLVKPASLSPEASAHHETVLNITAHPLERALAHVQKLQPRRRDIDPLLTALRPHLQQPRSCAVPHTELEMWSAAPSGLFGALRHSFLGLVNWSAPPTTVKQEGTTSNPRQAGTGGVPNYTHKLLLTSIRTFGAPTILSLLLIEAHKEIESQNYAPEVVLDVLTGLVCAPAASAPRHTMSLRQALHFAIEDAYAYSIGKDGGQPNGNRAELIVRLARRVEAQSPARPVVQPVAEVDAQQIVSSDAPGDMMIGLEGGANLGIDDTGLTGTAPSNDMLEGMLKDVDAAELGDLMDTDQAGELFSL